jgi:hypothetical protein
MTDTTTQIVVAGAGPLRSWRVGAQVSMSYRRPAFNFERIKPHMSMDLGDRLQKGEIIFYPATIMETDVPGLYVAGGMPAKFTYFISTSHDHAAKIMTHATGIAPEKLGTVPARNNAVTWEEAKAN